MIYNATIRWHPEGDRVPLDAGSSPGFFPRHITEIFFATVASGLFITDLNIYVRISAKLLCVNIYIFFWYC